MAVRESLLGIMTLGPAYGLQLHAELSDRCPHRQKTNVGQIYGTLERLTKAGLVESAGENGESLPLYKLSALGSKEAEIWLSGEDLQDLPQWDDLLDMMLISRSVSVEHAHKLHHRLKELVRKEKLTLVTLSDHAHARYIAAVDGWLDDVEPQLATGVQGYTQSRRKRGRPPSTKLVQ